MAWDQTRSAALSDHNPGPKLKSCHNNDRRSEKLKKSDRRIYSTSRDRGDPLWDRVYPENSPRQLRGYCDPQWRPRQSSEPIATAARG
ncbi:hypothetical protein NDU88_006936 [Pleurodeles waltl]|uniref:Uncharacterized protein n=1 Tax=Pleurodeles waltl TaxID=8319 RepID=A0AAV7WC05_PLEWA|nr:hypothetical protein NDU88_006936 [Pleurodeles waltl]